VDEDNELNADLLQVLRKQQQIVNEGHDLIRSLRGQVEANDDSTEEELYDTNDNLYDGAPAVNNDLPYGGAAGNHQTQSGFIPEPEDVEQEEAWQEAQAVSSGNSKLMEFFIDQLKDLLWAEKELVATLPDMAEAATSLQLKAAFTNHMNETTEHISRLEEIFALLGIEPEAVRCDAMAGIVDEGDNIISNTDRGTAQRDVGLIFAGQKAEHYEIASYGGMISLAKTLGYYEIAELLVLTIEEEKIADALLTEIAENHVNYDASTEPAEE
jgi:ferritin-like metal-binding protein YciE